MSHPKGLQWGWWIPGVRSPESRCFDDLNLNRVAARMRNREGRRFASVARRISEEQRLQLGPFWHSALCRKTFSAVANWFLPLRLWCLAWRAYVSAGCRADLLRRVQRHWEELVGDLL
jgi:hypothetical protein